MTTKTQEEFKESFERQSKEFKWDEETKALKDIMFELSMELLNKQEKELREFYGKKLVDKTYKLVDCKLKLLESFDKIKELEGK